MEYLVSLQPESRPPEFRDLEGENEIHGKHYPEGRIVLWPQWIWNDTRQFTRFVSLFIRTLLGERFCLAACEETELDHNWCAIYWKHLCPPENVARMGMSLRKIPLTKAWF